MKVKSYNQKIFILYWIFLLAVTISCNSKGQSKKENQLAQTQTERKLLKFASGVR